MLSIISLFIAPLAFNFHFRQAHQAVEYLDRLHTLKKRGRVPSSLHLELLISFIPVTQSAHTKSKPQSSSTPNRVEHYLPQVRTRCVLIHSLRIVSVTQISSMVLTGGLLAKTKEGVERDSPDTEHIESTQIVNLKLHSLFLIILYYMIDD